MTPPYPSTDPLARKDGDLGPETPGRHTSGAGMRVWLLIEASSFTENSGIMLRNLTSRSSSATS